VLELAVVALGEIYGAHPTTSELAAEAIGTDLRGTPALHGPVDEPRLRVEQPVGHLVRAQQRPDLGAECRVAGAGPLEPATAFAGLVLQRGLEELLDPLAPLAVHRR
jgi:hypothetical protein